MTADAAETTAVLDERGANPAKEHRPTTPRRDAAGHVSIPEVEAVAATDRDASVRIARAYELIAGRRTRRVFGADILTCARCGGRLVVLAFIEKLSAVRAILDHLGLPSQPLPLGKARGPPQVAWGF